MMPITEDIWRRLIERDGNNNPDPCIFHINAGDVLSIGPTRLDHQVFQADAKIQSQCYNLNKTSHLATK